MIEWVAGRWTIPASAAIVLRCKHVDGFRVEAFRCDGEFMYRVLAKAGGGWRKLLDASRADERRFPRRAARAGAALVEMLNVEHSCGPEAKQ